MNVGLPLKPLDNTQHAFALKFVIKFGRVANLNPGWYITVDWNMFAVENILKMTQYLTEVFLRLRHLQEFKTTIFTN